MSNAKQKTIDFLMQPFEKVFPGHASNKLVRGYMEQLSEEAFEQLMERAEKGDWAIPFYAPNLSDSEINKTQVLALSDEVGVKINERIVIVDDETGEEQLTPIEYPVVLLPMRRAIQHLEKKRSVAEDNSTVDHLTGQVTGDSKSSSLSVPESLALEGRGFNHALIELLKVRGGDDTALRAMEKSIDETGGASLGPLVALGSKPKVNETLAAYLFAMGYDNNLTKTE